MLSIIETENNLKNNIKTKKKVLKKHIGVVSKNLFKLNEISKYFEFYGYIVDKIDFINIEEYIRSSIKGERLVKGVMIEHTKLFRQNDMMEFKIEENKNLTCCVCESTLLFYFLNTKTNSIDFEIYKKQVNGYLNFKKKQNNENIFDWDDIFVPDGVSGYSNNELSKIGRKISPRINNISEIIHKHIHYKNNIELSHKKLNLKQVVNFGIVEQYLSSVQEFNENINPFMNKYKLTNILRNSVNQGIFIKSAKTYLQRLYWIPGLNSGLPLTPKSDEHAHEITYQFHDITHLNIPDLVFDGIDSELNKIVYIGYRLMSECITLVFADMIFVLSMIKNGMVYETMNNRKIFQIMEQILKINPNIVDENYEEFIHNMLRGSYEFCFYQDMTIWKSYMGGDFSCLDEYTNKYDKFFMEDFKWTNRNWKYMSEPSRKDIYLNWWNNVKLWIDSGYDLRLESVSMFIKKNQLDTKYGKENIVNKKNLLNDIFEIIYNSIIKPLIISDTINFIDESKHLTNAFIRYMIGQACVFFKFYEFHKSLEIFNAIDYEMKKIKENKVVSYEQIDNIKYFYHNYLKSLHDSNFVNSDFVVNSTDIYFVMKINSVNYDIETENELKTFVNDLLNLEYDTLNTNTF